MPALATGISAGSRENIFASFFGLSCFVGEGGEIWCQDIPIKCFWIIVRNSEKG